MGVLARKAWCIKFSVDSRCNFLLPVMRCPNATDVLLVFTGSDSVLTTFWEILARASLTPCCGYVQSIKQSSALGRWGLGAAKRMQILQMYPKINLYYLHLFRRLCLIYRGGDEHAMATFAVVCSANLHWNLLLWDSWSCIIEQPVIPQPLDLHLELFSCLLYWNLCW